MTKSTEQFVNDRLVSHFRLGTGWDDVCISLGGAEAVFDNSLDLLSQAFNLLLTSNHKSDDTLSKIQKFLKEHGK